MSKLIRRKKEIGAALAVALQLTTLTLIGVIAHFTGGPQQPANAPADSQISADQTQTANRPGRHGNRPKRPACVGCVCEQGVRTARHADIQSGHQPRRVCGVNPTGSATVNARGRNA